jgi:hypothetical protein
MAGLPFVLVATRTGKATHLGVRSPVVAWHQPSTLPAFTLCMRLAVGFAPGEVADVACLDCLWAAPKFMGWPAFTDAS